MRAKLKKILGATGLGVALLVIGGVCVLSSATVSARSKQAWLNDVPMYQHISSVQWAAETAERAPGDNCCSLWIGSSINNSTNVYFDVFNSANYDGFPVRSAYYWGMCTLYPASTGRITVKEDNGSIQGATGLHRGSWGQPNFIESKIDIPKFIEGLTPTQEDGWDVYKRTVKICRCYDGYTPADACTTSLGAHCSSQYDDVIVRMMSNHKLTVNYIANADCYGSGAGTLATVTLDGDAQRKAWVEKKSFPGYEFSYWEGVGFSLGASGEVNLADGDKTVNVYYDATGVVCDEDCVEWVPEEYRKSNADEGWTNVVVGVQNQTLTNDNNKWHHNGVAIGDALKQGVVWAKPTDEVQWKYCYYPGAQRTALSEVTKGGHPHPDESNELNNMTFMNMLGAQWKNQYHVETRELKPGSENVSYDVTRENGDAGVDVGTMPGEKDAGETYAVQQRVQPPTSANKMPTYDPGDTLSGWIWTVGGPTWAKREKDEHTWDCNEQCSMVNGVWSCSHDTCEHTNGYYPNDYNDNQKTDFAEVKVPYNFLNSATAKIAEVDSNKILYAGETVSLETAEIEVGKRQNQETQGNQWSPEGYATEVDNGHARMISFVVGPDGVNGYNVGDNENYTFAAWNDVSDTDAYGIGPQEAGYKIWRHDGGANVCDAVAFKNGRCNIIESKDGTLNELGDMNGAHEQLNQNSGTNVYNVYDEAAGNYYCVAAAVYPFTVRDDYEMDPNGDAAWLISKPSCRKIAKKPSFQVWGSGVFSAGDIDTLTAIKNNIKGKVDWHITAPNQETRMGSWGELAVTLMGETKEMASGAAMGYENAYQGGSGWSGAIGGLGGDGTVGTGVYGGWTGDGGICFRSPLTIANIGCSGGTVGNFDGETLRSTLVTEKSALRDRFTDTTGASGYSLEETSGDKVLSGITAGQGETKVYKIGGKATIASDITIATGAFTKLSDVPKVIIYANSIEVKCEGVSRIDAILVSDTTVNTCDNLSAAPTIISETAAEATNNNVKRRGQLVVNGTIVTGTLKLGRSFGGAAGANSMAPAELINYDSSIYLWANGRAEGGTSGAFVETASRELAPRW